MTTLSLRVPNSVAQKLAKWVKLGKRKDKSTAARELLESGWTYVLLEQYRQGALSLGRLAEELDLSISETMDLAAKHGAHVSLTYDDYLKSLDVSRKLF